ncbi:polysaccharide deacetylase family protein [Alteromonas oceanisediminis]|uniref:polysaccharide deacetylase family protein n=1 Tax=Alteromonas oceanisediminis TaxID=2836180 RepID=UPI001BDAF942|nr:polysaccharide deacetylase family protein [Alteromonas oceanisediminis]MBT0585666.1 polysaccharide deacetylase family protein [Alteromonas oceanisediminis]
MFKKLKRLARRLLASTFLRRYMWFFLPKGVYVFNYHRIGDSALTDFDRDIFSCRQDVFKQHLETISQHFTLVDTRELARIAKLPKLTRKYAMVTFDDGYLDNYTLAYPAMREQNVAGVFFLPTSLISGMDIPWWDEMAFILRSNVGNSVTLPGEPDSVMLHENSIDKDIRQFIYRAKRLEDYSAQDVLEHVRQQFPDVDPKSQAAQDQLFMSWQQVKDMADGGMEIGSHTINHHILARLSEEEQRHEIADSKAIIEEELQVPVTVIAYPVGRHHCFDDLTKSIVKESGYQLGFNNEPHYNASPIDPYDINRFSVNDDDLAKVVLNTMGSS